MGVIPMDNQPVIDIETFKLLLAEFQGGSKKKKKQTDKEPIDKKTNLKSVNPLEKVRTRKFCLTSYIDRSLLEKFVKQSPFIQHWALCSHDRDIEWDIVADKPIILNPDTGEPKIKEFHTHLLLYTYDAKTSSAVRKIFNRLSAEHYTPLGLPLQNTLCQPCTDMVSQWRYLIHQDEFEKDGIFL